MIDVNEYLKNFYKGTKNLSLKTMRYFMNKYNNFESKMKFIHIAGTNGKGSCTKIISSILVKQGYKVGKFLSPHLIRYNERISINNKEITDEEMLNLINECKIKNNNLHIVRKSDISNYTFDSEFQYFDYKDIKNLKINLKGKTQIQNASLCIKAIKIINDLGYYINIESIRNGLKTIVHKGRMEQINDKPIIIYDGAHNEPAIRNLPNMVEMYYKNYKRVYIISILKRKDYDKMLELLSEDTNALYILTSGNDPDRYATSDELFECMKKYVPEDKLFKKNLDIAIVEAMNCDLDTVNFIVGSFYTYGTVINKIKNTKIK